MTIPVKVQFQENDGKLITKEFKADPSRSVFSLKIEATRLIGLPNHRKLSLFYKKQLLPSHSSIRDSSISPGSTLILARKPQNVESKQIALTVRCNNSGIMVKASSTFNSNDSLLQALQSLKEGDKEFNALALDSNQLPSLTIANVVFDWKLIMEMREYSLVDFDISSNTLFVLNLQNAAPESISEFTTAISSAREIINQPPTSQLPKSHEKTQQQHAPAPIADSNAENSSQSNCPSFNVSISSVSTESAPDLPDSFYELTSDELKLFHAGYKNQVKQIVDRPFVSANYTKTQNTQIPKEHVTLKYVFPDKVCITATFPTSSTARSLYQFLQDNIVTSDVSVELYHAMKKIDANERTLVQLGIVASSRIVVNCNKCRYREGILS